MTHDNAIDKEDYLDGGLGTLRQEVDTEAQLLDKERPSLALVYQLPTDSARNLAPNKNQILPAQTEPLNFGVLV